MTVLGDRQRVRLACTRVGTKPKQPVSRAERERKCTTALTARDVDDAVPVSEPLGQQGLDEDGARLARLLVAVTQPAGLAAPEAEHAPVLGQHERVVHLRRALVCPRGAAGEVRREEALDEGRDGNKEVLFALGGDAALAVVVRAPHPHCSRKNQSTTQRSIG